MRDEEIQASATSEATETSPLIGAEGLESDNGKAAKSNGTFAGSPSSSTAGSVSNAENGGAIPVPGDEVIRDGLPELRAKMHLLMPAIGIGVSHYTCPAM